MPDDIIEDEEIAEQEEAVDDDSTDGFDSFDKSELKGEDAEPDEEHEEGEEPSEAVKEAEPPEDDVDARLEKRAKEIGTAARPESPPAAAATQPGSDSGPPPPAAGPVAPPLSRMDKERVQEYLSALGDDELPEGEIVIGDTVVNLREYQEQFPDEFNAVKVLSAAISRKETSKLADRVKSAEDMNQQLIAREINRVYSQPAFAGWIDGQPDEVKNAAKSNDPHAHFAVIDRFNAQQAFGSVVEARYKGYVNIVKSKEFKAWFPSQGDTIKALFGSMDPNDGILVLDAYSRDVARGKAKAHDAKVSGKKARTDSIHKGTMRARKTVTPLANVDKNDEQAGFELFKPDES